MEGARYRGHFGPAVRPLAHQVRRGKSGLVELDVVLAREGVRVTRHRLPSMIQGITESATRVVIAQGLNETIERYVLAHELGHVLVRRGAGPPLQRRHAEECFADAFARELLLPAHLLNDRSTEEATQISTDYDVILDLVNLQFATLGVLPEIMRGDSGAVLCIHCGNRVGLSSCPCLRFRQRPDLPIPAAPQAA
jgi:Zn-dependent peptidase ImmA (M78 family)